MDRKKSSKGFTLAELLIATVVFILAFLGLLGSYLKAMELSEMSRNSSTAVLAVKNRLEQIKNTTFNQILATYNNATFNFAGINGIGVSYVSSVNPNLLLVTISFCWRQKSGLVMGEDKNLNGSVLGEDTNGNGQIDSPVQLVTYIYNK